MVERLVRGRSFYPNVVTQEILRRVENGEPISAICADPAFPCERTWYLWLGADAGLRGRVDAARAAARRRKTIIQQGADHGS